MNTRIDSESLWDLMNTDTNELEATMVCKTGIEVHIDNSLLRKAGEPQRWIPSTPDKED